MTTPEQATELLARAGLDPDVTDPAETAADLDARTELNTSLDALVTDTEEPAVRFDPAWR